jgi:hypothetical protein
MFATLGGDGFEDELLAGFRAVTGAITSVSSRSALEVRRSATMP